MMKNEALVLALTSLLSGCVSASSGGTGGLGGNKWELEAFVSMDDAQGRLVPSADQRFSITFGADGKAAMTIDCNRGTASYAAVESSPTRGSLEFGPVASTRAMCSDPRIADILTSQLPNVTSYVIQNGKLSLALKMDGGIFVFVPSDE